MDWVAPYDAYLMAEWSRKSDERNDGCFHCSDLGQCQRKAIYRRTGLLLPPDIGRMRRLRQGTIVHLDYQAGVKEALGDAVAIEIAVDDGLPQGWKGTSDALLLVAPAGQPLSINDYKTVNAAKFRYAADFPDVKDCLQLGSYWWAAERKTRLEIPEGKITYVPLGSFDDPVQCSVGQEWKEEALREMARFDAAWEQYEQEEVLPPPPPPRLKKQKWEQAWECSVAYCDYRAQGYCEGGRSEP